MKKTYVFSIFLFCFLQLTAQPNILKRMWTTPYVLQSHEASFSFQIEINDNLSEIDSVQVVFYSGPIPMNPIHIISQEGNSPSRVTFLDDGLEDDLLANDRVYTASNLKSLLTIDKDEINIPKAYNFKLNEMTSFSGGSKFTEQSKLNFQLRWFKPASVPNVNQVNSTFQHTSHVVNIVDEDLEYDGYNQDEAYESYYEHLPDDRHAMVVLSTEVSNNTSTVTGRSSRLSNDVEGIGLGIFDYSGYSHSNGVLEQGILLRNGSEDGSTILHELHHRWGIKLPTEFYMSLRGHWSGTFEMSGGGGPTDNIEKIVSNGDSTYNVYYNKTRNWNTFNPIDMYLAGYGPLNDIKFPIKVIPNPTNMGGDTDGSTIMYSDDYLLYITRDLFIEKLGIRSPDYLNARREQRVAMMVRSQRLLTPVELAYFHNIMVEHEKTENSIFSPNTYFDLCGGAGRLITRISDDISSVENKVVDQRKFKIFPNPASTELNIELFAKESFSIQSGQIINSIGKVVLNFKFVDKTKIEIQKLDPGLYFLKIKIEEGSYTQQFLKID